MNETISEEEKAEAQSELNHLANILRDGSELIGVLKQKLESVSDRGETTLKDGNSTHSGGTINSEKKHIRQLIDVAYRNNDSIRNLIDELVI